MPRSCKYGGLTKPNGNCSEPGDDGLPVQCIGEGSREKHDYLARYLTASSGPRGRFVPPAGGPGGAAFVDLFAGPGRARVQKSGELVDGSPLLALKHERSPFTTVVLCDRDPENAATLTKRVGDDRRAQVISGDCNERIDEITALIPLYGLNFALLDPFGIKPLRFETIRKLATFERMDLLLHFPTGDIKRNLERSRAQYTEYISRFLGTEEWQTRVQYAADVHLLIDVLRTQLQPLGYIASTVRAMPVTTKRNVPIYHLVYASKNELGDRIWESIIKTHGSGQRSLF